MTIYPTIALLAVAAISVAAALTVQPTAPSADATTTVVTGPAHAVGDLVLPTSGDSIWAAIDAGSLDVRSSSAPPDSTGEAATVDYSSMWPYLNSGFGVEAATVDYSSMWPYLNSDYLGPVTRAPNIVLAAVDGAPRNVVTSSDPVGDALDDAVVAADSVALLGMVDSSILPNERWPG